MDRSTEPKDNANPVIHKVVRSSRLDRSQLQVVERWSSSTSIHNQTVCQALSSCPNLLQGLRVSPNRGRQNVYLPSDARYLPSSSLDFDAEVVREEIDADEIFDLIHNIQDPEHPLTLEQLNVVNRQHVEVNNRHIDVRFTPTIPHCSMATLIGLSLRVKLLRSLPADMAVTVRIQPGTHASEVAINKQLADKERVCAALENSHLLGVVNKCIANGMKTEL